MQGQRGAIGSLPETLGFEHGSASSDAGVVDQQIFWNNNNQNAPNRISDFISPADASDLFLNSTSHDGQNISMWNTGEASSSSVPNQVGQSHVGPRTEHGWSSLMKSCPEPHQYEPPARMLSLGDHASNGHHGPSFLQNNNVALHPSIGFKSSNPSEPCQGSSASASSFPDPFEPSSDPFELDGRRLSRKRKAVELSGGQSSGIGSSNMFQRPEGGGTNVWHPAAENPLLANTPSSDQIIPRLGLGVGGTSSENPLVENTHRNVRLRINASRQQDPSPATNNNGQSNFSPPYPSLRLNPVDLRSPPAATATATSENPSAHQGQPVLRIPALRRNLQSTSRWTRSSSARAIQSNEVISGDRNELDSRTMPTNISDHPLFVQPSEIRNVAQTEVNWSVDRGRTVSNGGNGVASSSRAGPSPGSAPSSATPSSAPHRGSPHYPPRRLSEFLRRSLLSATDPDAGGGQNINVFPRMPPVVGAPASSSQDIGIPPVATIQGHHRHQPHSRSSVLLGRQLDGAFGFPYLSRTMAAGSEGRGRLVSEIRNVLDLMRRGEPLRFEDVMILDQSVFYGVADIHDRHRDMRLDIDNMSYEELLALEERIGNVNTGLTEDMILKHLKQKQYATATGQPDAEPCCICQEEYKDGDDLGALECGHDFHRSCIRQWLVQKNLCPICKSTALAAAT